MSTDDVESKMVNNCFITKGETYIHKGYISDILLLLKLMEEYAKRNLQPKIDQSLELILSACLQIIKCIGSQKENVSIFTSVLESFEDLTHNFDLLREFMMEFWSTSIDEGKDESEDHREEYKDEEYTTISKLRFSFQKQRDKAVLEASKSNQKTQREDFLMIPKNFFENLVSLFEPIMKENEGSLFDCNWKEILWRSYIYYPEDFAETFSIQIR